MTEDEKMVFTAQIERTKSQADIQSAHNQELETHIDELCERVERLEAINSENHNILSELANNIHSEEEKVSQSSLCFSTTPKIVPSKQTFFSTLPPTTLSSPIAVPALCGSSSVVVGVGVSSLSSLLASFSMASVSRLLNSAGPSVGERPLYWAQTREKALAMGSLDLLREGILQQMLLQYNFYDCTVRADMWRLAVGNRNEIGQMLYLKMKELAHEKVMTWVFAEQEGKKISDKCSNVIGALLIFRADLLHFEELEKLLFVFGQYMEEYDMFTTLTNLLIKNELIYSSYFLEEDRIVKTANRLNHHLEIHNLEIAAYIRDSNINVSDIVINCSRTLFFDYFPIKTLVEVWDIILLQNEEFMEKMMLWVIINLEGPNPSKHLVNNSLFIKEVAALKLV